MPNKFNDARRHHIPKMRFRVTNWTAYEAGLRRRGSLTLWVSEDAIADWRAAPRTTPGGQARYSDVAIEAAVMVRLVFHQPLRQTEGLLGSLRHWCSELGLGAMSLSATFGYAMRTEFGRPASIMRLRTATPMAASAC